MSTGPQRRRTAVLVGSIGSGKTTLRQRLLGQQVEYAKTQALEVFDGIVDTPGEYLEYGRLRHALQLVAYEVELVILVHDATRDASRLPPGLATAYNRETWGVVTHTDRAEPAMVAAAHAALANAGAARIFELDALHGDGVDRLEEALCTTGR